MDEAKDNAAGRDALGKAVMDSMDIPQPQVEERLTMPVAEKTRGAETTASDPVQEKDMSSADAASSAENVDSFDKIDLDAIAASLTLAEEKNDDTPENADKKADTATDFIPIRRRFLRRRIRPNGYQSDGGVWAG